MPTYDYRCENCGVTREVFHGMEEAVNIGLCHECGGVLTRMISRGAGIIFKSGGFYSTDFRQEEEVDENL